MSSLLSFGVTVASLAQAVIGTNFEQCLDEVNAGLWGAVGGTDSRGNPVANISQAVGVTYDLCITACGASPEPFDWPAFYQQFSTWLLPYLALLSQLPFGADSRLSNFLAVSLTVGSPTLAAYSLILTVLNGRWAAKRFGGILYPNANHALNVLVNLQQSPIRLNFDDGSLASLVALHQNDDWWHALSDGLRHYNGTWTIAAVMSIAWVVIAYLMTVIDSFTHATPGGGAPFRALGVLNLFGKGVGFAWLWLVPIVVGWLQLSPKCDAARLRRLFKRAEGSVYVASPAGVLKREAVPGAAGLSIDGEYGDNPRAAAVHHDAQICSPIYNYARVFLWNAAVQDVAAAFTAAGTNCRAHRPVDAENDWMPSPSPTQIQPENRTGTAEQVLRYCSGEPRRAHIRGWKVYERIFVAGLIALSLQWGTTGAAMLVVFFAPTIGLGCESGSFLLYGVISTAVWGVMLASSVCAHIAHPDAHRVRDRESPRLTRAARVAGTLSIALRRCGKALAAWNAAWLVGVNVAQFSNFFDRCWCNSCALSLRARAYNVIRATPDDVALMRRGWVGGIVLGTASAVLFVGFVNLLRERKSA